MISVNGRRVVLMKKILHSTPSQQLTQLMCIYTLHHITGGDGGLFLK